jgi:hypothetical protein
VEALRLSRSLRDLLHKIGDTTTPAGRMMMQMVGAFADDVESAVMRSPARGTGTNYHANDWSRLITCTPDSKSTPHNPASSSEGEATSSTHIYGHLLLESSEEQSQPPILAIALLSQTSGPAVRYYVEHLNAGIQGATYAPAASLRITADSA